LGLIRCLGCGRIECRGTEVPDPVISYGVLGEFKYRRRSVPLLLFFFKHLYYIIYIILYILIDYIMMFVLSNNEYE